MVKKKQKRDWFIPLFEEGVDMVYANSQFPIGTFAFDSFDYAYAFAVNIRLTPIYDMNDELVLDKDGKATLPDFGKVTIVQIKTDKIDWKKVKVVSPAFHLRGMKETGDVIEFKYQFPYSKHSTVSLFEEPDDRYNKLTL